MAQKADGTVYIDTLLDTTGMKAGGKEVEAAVRRMAKSVSGIGETARIALQKQTDAFVKQNQAYAQQEQKVESLREKLEEMSKQKVATEEFKEIGKQIDSDTAKLNRLEKAQEEFLATGEKTKSSAYQRREMQIEELRNSIRYAKAEQDDLLRSGGAYRPIDTSGVEQKLIAESQKLQQMNNSLSTSYQSLKEKVSSYNNNIKKATSENKRNRGSAISLSKGLGRARNSLSKNIFTVLKYTVGIRSLYVLTNKLRNALKSGFQNLAQYSGTVNVSLSSIMSALTQLKNSLATAFAPILNVVAPTLTKFINMLAKATTYVGMFFASMSGQKTFTRAKEVQQDYAESLNNSAAAAKDAEKATKDYLSGLDEVRKFEEPDISSSKIGSSELNPSDMFEEVEIPGFIENIKTKFENVFGLIKDGFQGAFQADTSQLENNIKKIKKAVKEIWESNEVQTALSKFSTQALKTLGAVSGSVASVSTSFSVGVTGGIASAITKLKKFNKTKVSSILNNLTETQKTTEDLAGAVSTIATAFESDGFQKIVEVIAKIANVTILNSLDTLTGILSDLWSSFTKPVIDNKNKIERLLENVFTIVGKLLSPIGKLFDIIAKKSKKYEDSWLHKMFEQLSAVKSELIGKVLDGINIGLETMIDLLNGDITLNDAIKKLLDLFLGKGPSTVDIGVNLTNAKDTVVSWFLEKIQKGTAVSKTVATTINSARETVVSWFLEKIQNAKDVTKTVFTTLSNAKDNVVSWFLGKIKNGSSITKSIATTLLNAKTTVVSWLLGKIQNGNSISKSVSTTLFNAKTTVVSWFLDKIRNAQSIAESISATLSKGSGSNSTVYWLLEKLQKGSSIAATIALKLTSTAADALKKLFGLETGGIFKGGRWQPIQGYASGGMPSSAQVFMARENGMAELVGRIGRATAVMNNDQIVASVAAGVYRAVVAAFSHLQGYFASMTFSMARIPSAIENLSVSQTYITMEPPLMARGTIIPPAATVDQRSINELQDTITDLKDLLERMNLHGQQQQYGYRGGNLQFTAQLNRRTIFDEVIEEAKIRQMASGRNPFEMA